uniref:Receptor ligand binding region domain-containing protein n=1 Tax=Plectus sambesii TaxID=2011161 RepID=A0A914XDV9_9BILA
MAVMRLGRVLAVGCSTAVFIQSNLLVLFSIVYGAQSTADSRRAVTFKPPVYVLVPLPDQPGDKITNPFRLTSLAARPVVDIAAQDVYRKRLIADGSMEFSFRDSKLSDSVGPNLAVEALCENRLDVIIGYAYVYSLAPVARMSSTWKHGESVGVPVITTIGLVSTLNSRDEYKLLTRMMGSYKVMSQALAELYKTYRWVHYSYVFHDLRASRSNPNAPYGECYFQMESVQSELERQVGHIDHNYFIFDQHNITRASLAEHLRKASMLGNAGSPGAFACPQSADSVLPLVPGHPFFGRFDFVLPAPLPCSAIILPSCASKNVVSLLRWRPCRVSGLRSGLVVRRERISAEPGDDHLRRAETDRSDCGAWAATGTCAVQLNKQLQSTYGWSRRENAQGRIVAHTTHRGCAQPHTVRRRCWPRHVCVCVCVWAPTAVEAPPVSQSVDPFNRLSLSARPDHGTAGRSLLMRPAPCVTPATTLARTARKRPNTTPAVATNCVAACIPLFDDRACSAGAALSRRRITVAVARSPSSSPPPPSTRTSQPAVATSFAVALSRVVFGERRRTTAASHHGFNVVCWPAGARRTERGIAVTSVSVVVHLYQRRRQDRLRPPLSHIAAVNSPRCAVCAFTRAR